MTRRSFNELEIKALNRFKTKKTIQLEKPTSEFIFIFEQNFFNKIVNGRRTKGYSNW